MFRRIVSNLSFSPALVGQLGFYAKRLRKEEATRRLGLVFTALALVVQSLAVFSPPEAANAAIHGQVGGAPRCNVNVVGPRDSAFKINDNNKAVVEFEISGSKDCKVQLSVNSFYAPTMDGQPWSKQILYERTSQIYDKAGRYSLRAALPDKGSDAKGCFYQVDLTYGTNNVLPVLAYGHGRLDCGTATVASVACTSLSIIRASDTRFTLRAQAKEYGSGKVNAYVYTVKNGAGTVLLNKEVASGAQTNEIQYDQAAPGSYKAEVELKTNVGRISDPSCRASFVVAQAATPTAVCTNVNAILTNRTTAHFTGTAQASGGATLRSYTFIVKNAQGLEVNRMVVASSAESANTAAIQLPAAGNYSVNLVVQSSLGDRTDPAACVKQFSVAPPDVCQYNPSLPPSHPDCQPCPGNPSVWVKDKDCHAVIVYSKTATNLTQGNVNATTVVAKSSDKLTYTITAENKGTAPQAVTMEENLADVLEYANLVDQGGATLNEKENILTWPAITLAAGQKQSRTFAVQVMSEIPVTNTGTGVPTSYDCKLANTFGNTVMIGVECPVTKVVVEQVVSELPQTGPRENMIFAAVLLSVVTYFYARSRQLGREVRLIRRNLNTGTV